MTTPIILNNPDVRVEDSELYLFFISFYILIFFSIFFGFIVRG